MKKYGIIFGLAVLYLYGGHGVIAIHAQLATLSKNAPEEKWNNHSSAGSSESPAVSPKFHQHPALYPAKREKSSSLRQQHWHTHPDPYIEEGGAYTKEEHPAITDDQATMREYTSGTPNAHIPPPASVLNSSAQQSQQKVKITDPFRGRVPPIELPAS